MNGILIIDKPAGITSHDVVSRVRRILHTKRVGHTGTLDPFATGVMVILVGQATRLAQFLDKDTKDYEAVVRFGFETETGDRTGERKGEGEKRRSGELRVEEIAAVLPRFSGEIVQTPPMYSAKKIDGKKLYELARKGETVERKPVAVTIHELSMSEAPAVAGGSVGEADTICMRVRCSAGTYIRTLAEDIGRKLGVGAHLAELRRTAAGKFSLPQSISLEELAGLEDPAVALIPMNDAVSHLAKFMIPDDRINKTQNGLSTRVFDTEFNNDQPIQMVDAAGQLIAIGFFDAAENVIQPKVVLV
ncbi:MAG: tRNA pseudouridine(55) synthase TruB [Pyrinomonadaceae bacterium]|nr:tRNA pseudouridine(55) synthase TruB [Acidobacteriota bacterium]MBK7932779.1 tRNA pseudouridine(55) synthase TruB [Acidobacteriota bacterium]MBP7375008.1 tRNA pseudouridine(55) synthase TruB [Pyrinomonadaceae bacterium]